MVVRAFGGAGGAGLRLSGEWSLVSQVWLKVAGWLGQPSRAADECGRPFSPAALLAAGLELVRCLEPLLVRLRDIVLLGTTAARAPRG